MGLIVRKEYRIVGQDAASWHGNTNSQSIKILKKPNFSFLFFFLEQDSKWFCNSCRDCWFCLYKIKHTVLQEFEKKHISLNILHGKWGKLCSYEICYHWVRPICRWLLEFSKQQMFRNGETEAGQESCLSSSVGYKFSMDNLFFKVELKWFKRFVKVT